MLKGDILYSRPAQPFGSAFTLGKIWSACGQHEILKQPLRLVRLMYNFTGEFFFKSWSMQT
jgi:hypothetical protein